MVEAARGVGLVLSGGGTRLFAHIGFLWALDDAGLLAPVSPLGAVVGSSAGSLVGAMFALGYTPREMWETAYWGAWGYEPPAEPRAWRGDARATAIPSAWPSSWRAARRLWAASWAIGATPSSAWARARRSTW